MEGRRLTVLVTGGSGFIGSHVCDRLLDAGHVVVSVDDLSTGRTGNLDAALGHGDAFTSVDLDVRSPGLRELFVRHRPDVVMHLAAQAGVRPSLADPDHDASVNVLGSLNVLRSAAETGVRKLIYAASGGTLYGEPGRIPVHESTADGTHPESPYGISKKVVLDYLRYYSRHRSLAFTALALGNVFGPRQDPWGEAGVIAIFAAHLLEGRAPTIFGDGLQTRDYVYVEDVADAFVAAIDRGSGALINIGTGVETSVLDLFGMLSGVVGSSIEPAYGPQPEGELRRIALANELAASVLGWRPRTDLRSGLERTAASLAAAQPASG